MPELISQIIPSKPTISLDTKSLPQIKDWQVGKTYTVHLKIRETAVHEDKIEGEKTRLHATFEVIKAEPCDD